MQAVLVLELPPRLRNPQFKRRGFPSHRKENLLVLWAMTSSYNHDHFQSQQTSFPTSTDNTFPGVQRILTITLAATLPPGRRRSGCVSLTIPAISLLERRPTAGRLVQSPLAHFSALPAPWTHDDQFNARSCPN